MVKALDNAPFFLRTYAVNEAAMTFDETLQRHAPSCSRVQAPKKSHGKNSGFALPEVFIP
jgi:hypothetical protein